MRIATLAAGQNLDGAIYIDGDHIDISTTSIITGVDTTGDINIKGNHLPLADEMAVGGRSVLQINTSAGYVNLGNNSRIGTGSVIHGTEQERYTIGNLENFTNSGMPMGNECTPSRMLSGAVHSVANGIGGGFSKLVP